MFYNAREGRIEIKNASFDYIQFGTGKKTLLMIQGLNTNGIKGASLSLAYMYRMFAKEYTVYMFSRKHPLPRGYTTRDMARDQAAAMEQLGTTKEETCVFEDSAVAIATAHNMGLMTVAIYDQYN